MKIALKLYGSLCNDANTFANRISSHTLLTRVHKPFCCALRLAKIRFVKPSVDFRRLVVKKNKKLPVNNRESGPSSQNDLLIFIWKSYFQKQGIKRKCVSVSRFEDQTLLLNIVGDSS